jgi:hypothetical protein
MSISRGRWTDAMLDPFRSMGDDPVAEPVILAVFTNNEAETVNRMLRSIEANEHMQRKESKWRA